MVNRLPTGAIELQLKLSWSDIEAELKNQTDAAISETELPGFRKGKAPRDRVEPQLDKSQLLSKSLAELLPKIYSAAVTESKIKPILYPQIHIDKGKWGEDFEFTATTCEAPTVKLPEAYLEKIKKLEFKDQNKHLDTILEYLRKNSRILIPDPLVAEEANHRLAHLAENLSQLGMEMSKYLNTKKMTAEDLKAQTASAARLDLETEFILGTIQANHHLADRQATLDFLNSLPKT